MRLSTIAPLICCLLTADAHAAKLLGRCEGKTLRRDDPAREVIARCGAPIVNKRGVDLDGNTVERWYYLPVAGRRQPARILELSNGALARIRDLPLDRVQCGTRKRDFVRRGDSKAAVLAQCGRPAQSSTLGVAKGRQVEEWRYRVSRRARWSTYTATFLDDSLAFIEVYRSSKR